MGDFFLYYAFMDTNSPWKKFIDVFLAKNQELNLSAIRDPEGVYIKHVLDALELKKIFQFSDGQRVIDVGT
jgi:16S rRNA G527 N7-methylase RsmG